MEDDMAFKHHGVTNVAQDDAAARLNEARDRWAAARREARRTPFLAEDAEAFRKADAALNAAQAEWDRIRA